MPGDSSFGAGVGPAKSEEAKAEQVPLWRLYTGLSGEEARFSDSFLKSKGVGNVFDLKEFNFLGKDKLKLIGKLGGLGCIEAKSSGGLKYKIKKIPALETVSEKFADERVLEVLNSNPDKEYTFSEMVKVLKTPKSSIQTAVRKLVSDGKVLIINEAQYVSGTQMPKQFKLAPEGTQTRIKEKKSESSLMELYPGCTEEAVVWADKFLRQVGIGNKFYLSDFNFKKKRYDGMGTIKLLENLIKLGYVRKNRSETFRGKIAVVCEVIKIPKLEKK